MDRHEIPPEKNLAGEKPQNCLPTFIRRKFGDLHSSNPGDYEMTNVWLAARMAILPDD